MKPPDSPTPAPVPETIDNPNLKRIQDGTDNAGVEPDTKVAGSSSCSDGKDTELKEFTLFVKLPIEIRALVWPYYLSSQSRAVTVVDNGVIERFLLKSEVYLST